MSKVLRGKLSQTGRDLLERQAPLASSSAAHVHRVTGAADELPGAHLPADTYPACRHPK